MKRVQITTIDDTMSVSCKCMQLLASVLVVSMHINLLKIASMLWPPHRSKTFTTYPNIGMASDVTLHHILVQVALTYPILLPSYCVQEPCDHRESCGHILQFASNII